MWAVGAILAELFTLTPLFPGERYISVLYFMLMVSNCKKSNVIMTSNWAYAIYVFSFDLLNVLLRAFRYLMDSFSSIK